jgi:hypothetical protein
MSTPYQIMLKSIKVIENGTLKKEDGVNGFVATLYHPSVGKTAVVSTREISLRDNEEKVFVNDSYPKQILFKEEILNNAYLEVELTSIRKSSFLSKIFYKMVNTLTNEAIQIIPGGSIVSGLVKNTTESLFDIIKPADKIEIIGKIGWLIEEDTDIEDLHLNLTVPKEIVLFKTIQDADVTKYIKKKIHKDFVNGHVVLSLKKLN